MIKQDISHDSLIKAFQEILGDGSEKNPLLVARIPIICNDIRDIRNYMRLQKILGVWAMTIFTLAVLPFVTWLALTTVGNSENIAALQAQQITPAQVTAAAQEGVRQAFSDIKSVK